MTSSFRTLLTLGIVGATVMGGVAVAPTSSAASSGLQYVNRTTANGLGSNNVSGVFVVGSNVYASTLDTTYSATPNGGLSVSTNGGTSFTNYTTANGLGSNNVSGVFAIGSTIYASTQDTTYSATPNGGLGISIDGGTTITNKTTASGLGSTNVNAVFAVAAPDLSVTDKAIASNVATLTTSTAHGLAIGSIVQVSGVDATFNGTYTVTAVPTTTEFSYAKTAADVSSTAVSPAGVATYNTIYAGTSNTSQVMATSTITNEAISSNVATLTTSTAHGLSVGSIVFVSGLGYPFDNNHIVTAVTTSAPYQFSFAVTAADVTSAFSGVAELRAPGGLSISRNGGASFTHFNSAALCANISCTGVYGIYVSGSNIYLATGSHLAYSTNGGTTFTNAPTGELSEKGVYADGSTVYVATGFGVQYSTNYFATEPTTSGVSAGLADAYVTDVYVNGGTLFASTWGGLGISTNGGASFTNDTTENCLGDDFVFGTFVSGGIIYVATGGGLSISNGIGAGCGTSGGGGGGSSTSTSTTDSGTTSTTTPVVITPVVAAIPPGTNSNIPASGLAPGSSVFLVNGVASPLTIKPNQPVNPKSLVATGDGFTMDLEGRGSTGQPLGLTSDAALRLERGSTAQVKGSGFAANSDVQVYLFSTTRFLGSIRTNASGAFDGSVPVPADVALGRHTLQANALGADNNVRSLSIGVVLEAPAKPVRTAKATVSFDPLSTVLTPQAKKKLLSLAKKTKRTATGGFAIGYVQKDSNTANNASLSKQRARAIVRFLKAHGVTAPLTARGNGVLSKKKTGRSATVTVRYTGTV